MSSTDSSEVRRLIWLSNVTNDELKDFYHWMLDNSERELTVSKFGEYYAKAVSIYKNRKGLEVNSFQKNKTK